jgi:hypothetical protein
MGILFAFYKLFLEREDMHVFKRFYLLLAIAVSFLVPTLVFTEYVIVEPIISSALQPTSVSDYDYIGVPPALEKDILDIEPILWTVYFLGLVFFGLKFVKNLFQIIGRIRRNPKRKTPRFVQVLLQENFPPHTFFSYIFLNKKKLESKEIPDEVLLHEETHARQKHSFDVLGIEMLQVLFWFNPLVYLFKKAIKLNHEFLADQAVLKKDIDKTTYQSTLLSYLSNDSEKKYRSQLTNAINYSSIKKRFTVMKTHTSKKAMLIRSLLLLPLLTVLIVGFSETKLIQTRTVSSNETIETFEQKNATPEQLEQYNVLAKNYNEQLKETRVVPLKDLRILEHIYSEMSKEQKENAQPFPECQLKTEMIQIEIDKKGAIRSGGNLLTIESLPTFLQKYTSKLSKEERKKSVRTVIKVAKNTPQSTIDQLEQTLIDYGVVQIDIQGPKTRSSTQDSASRKQMGEYNKLAKYYNEMPRKQMKILKKDVERLEYIYGLMSDKQKADAEPFPDFPEPPPAPKAPKEPKTVKANKVKKAEKSNIPPPPPTKAPKPPKGINEREEAAALIEKIIEEQDPYDIVTTNNYSILNSYPLNGYYSNLKKIEKSERTQFEKEEALMLEQEKQIQVEEAKLVQKEEKIVEQEAKMREHEIAIKQEERKFKKQKMAIQVEKEKLQERQAKIQEMEERLQVPTPPLPPEPISPLDHAIEMAKQGATFYYKKKKITADEAIAILKKNKDLSMDISKKNNETPVVKIDTHL